MCSILRLLILSDDETSSDFFPRKIDNNNKPAEFFF